MASPLRILITSPACRRQLAGVFVDVLRDGSVKNPNRLRSGEDKRGRVCMTAIRGYITLEIRGKFPGL